MLVCVITLRTVDISGRPVASKFYSTLQRISSDLQENIKDKIKTGTM